MTQERNFITQELKTAGGKDLAVFKIANTSLYRVAFTSGGQIPEPLEGAWTDPVMAQRSIVSYLQAKESERIAAEEKKAEAEKAKLVKEAANRAKNVPKNKSTKG